MNFVRRITAGRGIVRRSERTTRSESDSMISALPSITRRSARRIGTMVSGSYEAFNARHPRTTKLPLPLFEDRHTNSRSTAGGRTATGDRRRAPSDCDGAQLHAPEGSTVFGSYAVVAGATRQVDGWTGGQVDS